MRSLGLLFLLALLSACASVPKNVIDTGDRYSPISGGIEDYRLGAGDRMKLTVFNEPTLSGEFAVTASGELIVKVVNTADRPLETEIHLANARQVGTGKAIVLAGDPSAVNSLAQPANVAPKEEPLTNAAVSFGRTFPPHSVTLLRFPAKK